MNFVRSSQGLFRSLASAVMVFALVAVSVQAFDPFSYDLRLIGALADTGMPDYAMTQVTRMLKLYPDKKDAIILEKALVFYAQGKRTKAEGIIEGITKGSPLFARSRLIKAREAFKRGAFEEAVEGFTVYFATNPSPDSQYKPAVDDFHRSVLMFAKSEVELGNPQGAAKAMGNATLVKGEYAYSEYLLAYQKSKYALDACDKAVDLKKSVKPDSISSQIKKMMDLQFKGIPRLLMVNTLIEVAHGHVLLGNLACEGAKDKAKAKKIAEANGHYKAAFTGLKALPGDVARFDTLLPPKDSPAAGMYFYLALIRKGQARVALLNRDKTKAVAKLKQARERLRPLKTRYSDSPYGVAALVEDGKIVEILKKLGEKVEDSGGNDGGALVKITQADRYYAAKNYEKAASFYLDALRMARVSKKLAPRAGFKLVVCYTNLPAKMLEARAVASYLADVFPDAQETSNALLQLGIIPYNEAKKMKDGPEKQALMDEAMGPWDKFVEIAPDNTNATDIAFIIAENAYMKAANAANRTQAIKDKKKKEAAKQAARDMFRSAIDKYERVITLYGGTPRGVRSYYKLGWIYDALDQPHKAAKAFLTYATRENLPAHNGDRLEAQFRAGEQLLFSDTPTAAIDPLKKLLTWVLPSNTEGFDATSKKALEVKENGTSYEAWAYDLSAEAIRPKLTENKDQQGVQQAVVKEANVNLTRIAKLQKELEEWRAGVLKEIKETTVDFAHPLSRPEEKALQEFMPEAEVSKWTPEERAIELPKRKASAAKLAKDYLGQAIQSMTGFLDSFTANKDKYFKTLQVKQNDLEEVGFTLKDLDKQLVRFNKALKYSQEDLDKLTATYASAVQVASEAKSRLDALKKRYDAARKAYQSGDEAAKIEARKEGREVQTLIPGAQARLAKAVRAKEALESDAAKSRHRALLFERDANKEKVRDANQKLTDARRQKALLTADAAYYVAQVRALAQAIKAGNQYITLMSLPEASRYSEENTKEWQTIAASAVDMFEKVKTAAAEKVKVAGGFFSQDREAYVTAIAEAQKTITKLAAERQPLQTKFEGFKTQAREAFNHFLETYPNSKHVPDNMARLGVIYIELNQYKLAESTLNKLAEKFPDHAAVKQAMFSLGKVQFEIGKVDEAAKAFKKVLANIGAQASPNLKFIVRAMMNTKYADLGLRASQELLARGADINNPDYEKLSGTYRETILFQAGVCAMGDEKYQEAVNYFDTLLKENEKTARFYEANILKARACRLMTPPDAMAAKKALAEVMRYTQDSVVMNEALVEKALVELIVESKAGASKALGPLGQIALVVNGEVVVLADLKDPDSRDFVDQGFYLAAKCYALLGETKNRDLVVAAYRKRFPDGKFKDAIKNLPNAL